MHQIKFITVMLHGFISKRYLEGQASYAAFWWSPDGSKMAYLRTDETDVPVFTLNRLDEPDGLHGLIEAVPYPLPGDPNPKLKWELQILPPEKQPGSKLIIH